MIIAIAVVVVLLGVVFGIPLVAGWAESSAGQGSGTTGAFGVMEEIFHPAAHDANIVKMEIKENKAPAPAAGEGDADDQTQ